MGVILIGDFLTIFRRYEKLPKVEGVVLENHQEVV